MSVEFVSAHHDDLKHETKQLVDSLVVAQGEREKEGKLILVNSFGEWRKNGKQKICENECRALGNVVFNTTTFIQPQMVKEVVVRTRCQCVPDGRSQTPEPWSL